MHLNSDLYKVFCQVNILDCNGIAVINKTATGFDIVEINGGTHSGEVDYQIIAKPKTNFGEGRFPQAPGPGFLKPKNDPEAAYAKNRPDYDKVYKWPADWDVYKYDPADYTEPGNPIEGGANVGLFKMPDGSLSKTPPSETTNNTEVISGSSNNDPTKLWKEQQGKMIQEKSNLNAPVKSEWDNPAQLPNNHK
jgi:hypothetical protein